MGENVSLNVNSPRFQHVDHVRVIFRAVNLCQYTVELVQLYGFETVSFLFSKSVCGCRVTNRQYL